ncbi:MAG: YidC/Oxa1 family membrane protein insertase [Candidatus Portnoybacteria bacterium]|nr:YidC/Oxa1 family membrane protein insertase [Candidatus Portnoybacteria bacterium]MDD4982715.1 YidC/Oxa1 family membrane protein insertase [Candidatus Portnoybacteria bacterium]
MNIITIAFNEVLYRPLFNGLIFLYNAIPPHDFGVAIILLTVIIRLILYPLNQKAITSQKSLGALAPQIKELQNKYSTDKVKQSQALMELYKKNNINPASGCLPLLIQLPILIALYQVFLNGLKPESLNALYSFVASPGQVDPMFLGLISLANANVALAILAGAFTFWQSKMMVRFQPPAAGQGSDFSAALNKQMLYFMPLFTVFIAWRLPAGLTLYWVVTTLAGVIQQYFVIKKHARK